jgi:hypothetical protein
MSIATERLLKSPSHKARGGNSVSVTLICEPEDLEKINARVRSLGLVRSNYLVYLSRNDWLSPRDFPIPPRRRPKTVSFKFSCLESEIVRIDDRAANLGITRSRYLVGLARVDFYQPVFTLLPQLEPSPPASEVPGIVQYHDGTLDIDASKLLQFLALTDTPENRALSDKFAAEVMAAKRLGN